MEILLIIALLAYLIGSIPFGLLLTKWAGLGDVRKIGSGNIGATNVLRTGSKKLALATLLLDFSKTFVPLILLSYFFEDLLWYEWFWDSRITHQNGAIQPIFGEWALMIYTPIICLFLMFGHMFPIWLKFKGGKGVACLFGIFFAYNWQLGCLAGVLWLSIFFSTRYSSLAAIISMPLTLILFEWIIPYLLYGHGFNLSVERFGYIMHMLKYSLPLPIIMMIFKHHDNIRRLIKGEEHRFTFSKKEDKEKA